MSAVLQYPVAQKDRTLSEAGLPSITESALIRAHVHASALTVLISALFGLAVSMKLHTPFGSDAWSTWGRLRYNHTQGIFFGWLGNAFLAFCYYVVPRLTNRRVSSRTLGWVLFALWNFAVVLPGWTLVLMGHSQPLEWAEFPLIVDLFVVLAFALSVWQFVVPFLKLGLADIYVSGWYLIGGILFTLFAYPVGNLVPQLVPGAMGAAFSGLWIHDAVGLFVTPLALMIAYWVIPATTGRPIWSHFLSMLGFWLLFFIYPLNGTHHYVYSAIPMSAQKGAILASVYLGMDVLLVTTNLLVSFRGGTAMVGRDIPLRYVWTGVVLYLVVSLQGSMQAMMPVNRFVHFTDWVIGHSHLAMIGFASMIAAGGIAHVWQRIADTRYNQRYLAWSYWLIITGLALMVIDLTMAGVVEAQLWDSGAPWIDSIRAARPYWVFRTFTGVAIILGFLFFWVGLLTGPEAHTTASVPDSQAFDFEAKNDLPASQPIMWLGSAYGAASVAGFGFFALSFIVLGIIPARQLQAEISRTIPREAQPPNAAEQRGRLIYGRDGCAYCHTEQIRTTLADIARFGAPTAAWETQYDYPQLWGTRRVGPDLAREAGVRSDDWQLTHLYNPRLVVRDSVMPAYSYMFNGSASQPNEEALDLLAYLRSLGRNGKVAGVDQEALVSEGHAMPGMAGHQTAAVAGSAPWNGNEAVPMTGGSDASTPIFHPSSSADARAFEARHGAVLFAANCAGCHGTDAGGHGAASSSLFPMPANLAAHRFTDERLSAVLWQGVYGSAMPAWREYSEKDLRDLVAFIQQLPRATETSEVSDASAADKAQSLFIEHCASCHGEHGDGRGPAAGALAPAPTNFHLEQPTRARALEVLEHGVPGTAMPSWTVDLSDSDRQLLSGYIRSFFATPTTREQGATR
ncbi:MAG TPA: cbb3-type cytochrome c oxidase subunit I [Bryobacteraceae bacterium]|nr:cbb3-type cytochrome c oxidase subunit I [Bryobacteraceae bacterium]